MADKIIGIEVAGLVYGIEDTETANVATQAKTTANEAATTAGEAVAAISEQAEKVAEIEANIGDNNISEIASDAEAALESATEVSGEIELINTRIDKIVHSASSTPRFLLERITPQAISPTPTISAPVVAYGSGITQSFTQDFTDTNFSLAFYDDAVKVTYISAVRSGAVPSQGNSFGSVMFGILFSKIEQLLKEKYPDRIEEIENYVTSHLKNPNTSKSVINKSSIVFQGEPGAECYTTQLVARMTDSQTFFSFAVNWDLTLITVSQGFYGGSTYTPYLDDFVRYLL